MEKDGLTTGLNWGEKFVVYFSSWGGVLLISFVLFLLYALLDQAMNPLSFSLLSNLSSVSILSKLTWLLLYDTSTGLLIILVISFVISNIIVVLIAKGVI